MTAAFKKKSKTIKHVLEIHYSKTSSCTILGPQKQCSACVSARSVYLKAVNLKALEKAENDNVIEHFSSVYRFYLQFIAGKLMKLY